MGLSVDQGRKMSGRIDCVTSSISTAVRLRLTDSVHTLHTCMDHIIVHAHHTECCSSLSPPFQYKIAESLAGDFAWHIELRTSHRVLGFDGRCSWIHNLPQVQPDFAEGTPKLCFRSALTLDSYSLRPWSL